MAGVSDISCRRRPYGPDELPLARTARTGEEVVGEEIQFTRGDGSRGIGIVSSSAVRDADGRTVAVVVTLDEVTERREKEEQLEWLGTFPTANPYPITEVDLEGHVFFLNPVAERLFPDLKDKQASHPWLGDWEAVAARIRRGEAGAVTREVAVAGRWYQQMMYYVEPARRVRIYGVDITERRRAEETLRESEERFRIMADRAPVIIWVTDPEGKIQFANRTYREFFGVDYDQVSGDQWLHLVHPDDAAGYGEAFVSALRTRTAFRAEARVRRADGEWRWIESHAEPRFSPGGEFLGYSGISPDITDRKRAADALKASEEREREQKSHIQTVLDTAPAAIWTTFDRNARTIQGNRAATEFLRVPEGTNLSKIGDEAERLAHYHVLEDGVEPAPENHPVQRVAASGRALTNHTMEIAFDDGTVLSLLGNISPVLDSEGRPAGAIAAFVDISDRKRAEEALRESEKRLNHAQEISHLGSWELDLRTNRLTWSDEIYRIFGLKPQEFGATYEAFLEAVHPDDRAAVDTAYLGSLKAGGSSYEIEHRIVMRDTGEVRWVHEKCDHESDATGAVIRSTGMVQDITERKQAEEDLRKAHDELELRVRERTSQLRALTLELTQAENRERKQLATVLHDHLQQLLVGAKLGLELTKRMTDNGELLNSLAHVDGLLDESIKASKSLTLELSPPILHEAGLVAAIEWLSRWMAEKHSLVVEVIADGEIEPDTQGVSMLLFESVRELLFNVVKHAGVKKAQVSVTRSADEVRITVADQGCGFDAETVGRSGPKAGFGLFSVKERLSLIGGRVEVDSTRGLGTRVTLITPLPKRVEAEVAAATWTLAAPAAGGPTAAYVASGMRKIRVLVADDHKILREGLTQLLRAEPDIEIVG
jgi:PAS domain S-box-containing protein